MMPIMLLSAIYHAMTYGWVGTNVPHFWYRATN